MQENQINIFWGRDDTFFGVCTAIGEDFGINRLWLRLGFAAFLFYSPTGAIVTYLGAALIIGLTRLLVPNPRIEAAETVAGAPVETVEDRAVEASAESREMAIAA